MTPALHMAVVVPFLDEAEHLPVMLESLAAQQRPPDRVILVDDGSSDDSGVIAERFAEAHPQARVVRRPQRARAQRHQTHIVGRGRSPLFLGPSSFRSDKERRV